MSLQELEEAVAHGSFEDAVKIVVQHKESDFASDVCKYMVEQFCDLSTERLETLKKLMDVIVTQYDTMDILLQLIEGFQQLGEFDQVKFVNLLEYLGKVTMRLPRKRYSSIVWGLNAVKVYVNHLELAEQLSNDDEADVDQVVQQILLITWILVRFNQVLIDGLNHDRETKSFLLDFVIHLLDKPIAVLNFKDAPVRAIVTNVIEQVVLLKPDPFFLLDRNNCKSARDYQQPSDLALGTLFYLVLCENVCTELLPHVYDSVFIFRNCLRFVILFLKSRDNQMMLKDGLRFSRCLLERVKGRTLSHHILDDGVSQDFCVFIINVIIFDDNQKHRTAALAIFRTFLLSFDTRGRYLLIYNLMSVLTYPGIRSYLITLYKDILKEELDKADLSVYFRGSNLKQTIDLFCETKTSKKFESVLENSDPIIANLNLLRFLISRDKNNVTQIWDNREGILTYLGKIGEDLKALKSEIESKRSGSNAKDDETCKFSVSVPSDQERVDEMMKMAPEEQEKVYSMALLTIDVIDSLAIRLNELIEAGP